MAMNNLPKTRYEDNLAAAQTARDVLRIKKRAVEKKSNDWHYKAGSTVIGKLVKELQTGKSTGSNPYGSSLKDLFAREKTAKARLAALKKMADK